MEVSDYIELAIVAIILAVCISLGIGVTTSTYKKVVNDDYKTVQNKNTMTVDLTAESVDGSKMTYEDVILMVEVQDYQMNKPNEFTVVEDKIAVGTIELDDRYREKLTVYSNQLGQLLKGLSIGDIRVARYRVYTALEGDLVNKNELTYAIELIK